MQVSKFIEANDRLCRRFNARFPSFSAFRDSAAELMRRTEASLSSGPERVLEVGGIDRPMLSKHRGFTYVGLDIEESPKCHEVYDSFIVQSIGDQIEGPFDLIVSKGLLEHVPDNEASMRSVYQALRPGGVMHHYVPSANHPYSLALRLMGSTLQRALIRHLRPAYEETTGYATFFDHCTVNQMRDLLQRTGYEAIDIVPYYRATDYFTFFFPLYLTMLLFEKLCERLDWTFFASGFVVSARRTA